MQIALELEPFKLSLLNDVPNMVRFIDDVGHPAVKANIDVSHLQLAGTKPEELRRLKGKAIHVHISDCDGKVHGDLPPGRGVVDFGPYLREIKRPRHRRGDQHRAGILAGAGQDRRLGGGGVPRRRLMREAGLPGRSRSALIQRRTKQGLSIGRNGESGTAHHTTFAVLELFVRSPVTPNP